MKNTIIKKILSFTLATIMIAGSLFKSPYSIKQPANITDVTSPETLSIDQDIIVKGLGDKITWDEKEDKQWNLEMINADNTVFTEEDSTDRIKVAIIDSGIDLSDDLDVCERKNFVPNEDDVSVLYEDASGHGTAVAGVIAAKKNDDGITGINENIELYSAKVLDENNQAPVSRVVQAIDWAIEKDVQIINMSLGTPSNSTALHNAIKKATKQGILVIVAAGNGGDVEYPAAYDETLAVGSIGADGKISKESSTGEEIDVVAPGEQIISSAAFDGVMASGGTSMAAPHVTGVASVLWQKNSSVTADFIRRLICDSAKSMGDDYKYGYGVVDLEYALDIYDDELESYQNEKRTDESISQSINPNDENLTCFSDVDIIEGRWSADDHAALAELNDTIKGTDLKVLKRGARISDWSSFGMSGMTSKPYLHGFYKSNYIGAYVILTQMATSYYTGNYSDPTARKGLSESDFNALKKLVGSGINGYSWSTILKDFSVTNKNKALIVYGMALHTASDAFAHSTLNGNGNRIVHSDNKNIDADNIKYKPNRYNCAKEVIKELLIHIKNGKQGNVADFAAAKNVYKDGFKMIWFSKYARATNNDKYTSNKAKFDAMTNDSFQG